MDYLTLYELEQTHAIAAWKSERPSLLRTVAAFCNPLIHRVTHVVERTLIERALDDFARSGSPSTGQAEVARLASVSEITQLRYSPLMECDRLAATVFNHTRRALRGTRDSLNPSRSAQSNSNIPPVLTTVLGMVCRIGHCYGYRVDPSRERHLLLTILDYTNSTESDTPSWKHDSVPFPRLSAGNHSRPHGLEKFDSRAQVSPSEPFVPNAAFKNAFALDYGFLNRAAEAARRVFQEQWLVDNGKTEPIAPASRHRRSSLDDLGRAMGHAAYIVGGAIGFGAVFPVVALSRAFAYGDRPGARGARDGAEAAARHADQLMAGILGEAEPQPDALPVPVLRVMLG